MKIFYGGNCFEVAGTREAEAATEALQEIISDTAIKKLAGILAKQEAWRTANKCLEEMNQKSAGLEEKISAELSKILSV